MADFKREFKSLEEVKEVEAKIVGGEMEAEWYIGVENYTVEEYNKVGITWEHNFWSKDRYFIKGVRISQEIAEQIVLDTAIARRTLTDDELRIIGVPI